MYKYIQLFLLTALFSMSALSTNLPDKLLNSPLHLISGETITLAQHRGNRPVYLKFWATWCQPCRKEMPHFEHIQKQYGDSIEIIGINLGINDTIADVENTIKEFGLTMPMAIDKSGDLAQSFRLIGTPDHLLFDRGMNLVHRGHKADQALDNKIDLLSQSSALAALDRDVFTEQEADLPIDLDDGQTHALFFTATWCDWYLKDSRPTHSQHCITAQNTINSIAERYPDILWQGIVSRLWTDDKALTEYKKKYAIKLPVSIDKSNRLFHQYSVKDLPTLVVIRDGKAILTLTDLRDEKRLSTLIENLD